MEAGLTFPEIARLISRTNKTEIHTIPVHTSAGATLYNGVDKDRRSHDPFQVIYLAPNCTQDGIDDARRAAQRTEKPTEVVYAPSLPKRTVKYQELLRENWIVKSYNTREYLLSFIRTELENYQNRLSEIEPTHYIQPRVKTPSGVSKKIPDPLESILVRDDGDKSPGIGILLAEPGQGKTYTTQHLATRLLNRKIIPMSRLRNSWGWRLGAVLNSPGKHPFALDRRLDAGSGGPAARREVEVGLFRRVADRASEHRWVTDAGRAPRGVAGGALVMSPGVRAGRR